jgi:hypothetical protein
MSGTPGDEGEKRYKHSTKKRGSFYNRCAPGQVLSRKEFTEGDRTYRLCKNLSATLQQRKQVRTQKSKLRQDLERCRTTLPYYSAAELEAAIREHKSLPQSVSSPKQEQKRASPFWKNWNREIAKVEKEVRTPIPTTRKERASPFWKNWNREIAKVEKEVRTPPQPQTRKERAYKLSDKEDLQALLEVGHEYNDPDMIAEAQTGLMYIASLERKKNEKLVAAKHARADKRLAMRAEKGEFMFKQAIDDLNEQYQAKYRARPTSVERLEDLYKRDYREIMQKSPTKMPWKK